MSFYTFFRISKPSASKIPENQVDKEYRRLRSRTFWGVAAAYCMFYVCRMALSVVKQPVIDEGVLTPAQIGLVDSALLFVYAIGKFTNGFIADYCNIRRFMATGLVISSLVNLVMGLLGLLSGWAGLCSVLVFAIFFITWGLNGWVQSMGAPPGVISLSRWFPLRTRGTYYSIFCATPYLGKSVSMVLLGHVVMLAGWQCGFIAAALAGFIGSVVILVFVSDTPESRGLPSVQELSGEKPQKEDSIPTKVLHKAVLKNPGVWVIALSSAFVYITQYGISNWGIFFLQKAKDFSLTESTYVIGISEGIGVVGTVFAGWLSDKVFRGDRLKPVLLCGVVCLATMSLFMFTGGGRLSNIALLSVASLSLAAIYCIVGGLMALDIVPRKATGAALGVVGISSYIAAGIQGVVSGLLIGGSKSGDSYDFAPVAIFWTASCLVSFLLPVLNWNRMKKKVIE
ncbi:MAG: MFS transporter [Bacteroidales bacterium]|nr:MFS transporter [Bacteroidales bacterium]